MGKIKPTWNRLRLLAVGITLSLAAGGVTYAALQSQNDLLTGNSITSATANLLMADGSGNWVNTLPGFSFVNMEPGGAPVPIGGEQLILKNAGTTPLALKMSMDSASYANPQQVSISKISVLINLPDGTTKTFSLADLCTAYNNAQPLALDTSLAPNQTIQMTLQTTATADIVPDTTSSFGLINVNFIFSGTSVSVA